MRCNYKSRFCTSKVVSTNPKSLGLPKGFTLFGSSQWYATRDPHPHQAPTQNDVLRLGNIGRTKRWEKCLQGGVKSRVGVEGNEDAERCTERFKIMIHDTE